MNITKNKYLSNENKLQNLGQSLNLGSSRYYYLARWVWNDTNRFWEAPFSDKIIGLIDLRSIPQQSIAGETPQGFGLFAYNQSILSPNLFFIGTNNSTLLPIIKTGLQNRLNITLNETTLENVIFEILTVAGDPTGQNRWKPLLPSGRTLEVWISNEAIKSKVVNDWISVIEWNNIKLTLQEDFKETWDTEGNISARKMLTTWMEKYKVNYSEFLPAGFENVTPLPHSTTVTDNFNRADASTLGASWSVLEEQVAGDGWRISANRAIVSAAGGFSVNRYDTNLASSDHYAQINMQFVNLGRDQGPLIRKDGSTALTYYLARAVHSTGTWNTYKRVNGTLTSIGTNAGPTPTVGDILKINASGSTITRWVNGILNDTATDTAVTVGLRAGIQTDNGETRVDDFEAADLAVSDTTPPKWTINTNTTNATIAGKPVNHTVTITDETALDYYIFEFNNDTITATNLTTRKISGTSFVANETTRINNTLGALIQWKYYFNDTTNNWNKTDLFKYIVNGVDCADNRTESSNIDLTNNNLIFIGSGRFIINANITNIGQFALSNSCQIDISNRNYISIKK